MAKQYKVLVSGAAADNQPIDVPQFAGDKGQPVRIKAKAGAQYQLQEIGSGKILAPNNIKAKRKGDDLEITFEDGSQADLIIEDYYDEASNGLIGQAESGSFYEFIPEDPNVKGMLSELVEGGQSTNMALGGIEVSPFELSSLPLAAAIPGWLVGSGAAAAAAAVAAGGDGTVADTTAPSAPNVEASDNVGTITGPIANNGKTDDATPTFTGKGTPGDVITVYDGTTPIGSAVVAADGTYSVTPTTPLNKGDHSITTKATDPAGNTSEASAPLNFTFVDAPGLPVITKVFDNKEPRTGLVNKGETTNDDTVNVVGTGTPGAVIYVYENGAATATGGIQRASSVVQEYEGKQFLGSAQVDANGNWSMTTTSLGADGVKNLVANAVDDVGQISPFTNIYSVVLDTAAPAKPATSVATDDVGSVKGSIPNGGTTDDAAPNFSGTGTPGDLITVYDGTTPIGSAVVAPDGTYNVTPTKPLSNGDHSITTQATDPAGNTSAPSAPLNIKVDTSPVTVTIDKAQDNAGTVTTDVSKSGATDDTTPTLVGTATANSVVTISEGGTVLGSTTASSTGAWSFTPATAQTSGAHTYSATAVNAAGTSSKAATFDLNIDTTAAAPSTPVANDNVGNVTGTVPNNGTTDDATPTFSGTGTPGDVVTVFDGTKPIGSAVVAPDGTYSVTPTTPLSNGDHSITTKATDPVGNTSAPSAPLNIKVDASPVTVTIDKAQDNAGTVTTDVSKSGATDDTTPTLVGTATANAVVTISEGGTVLGSTTASSAGAWSFTPATAQTSGAHTYSATAVNAAGTSSKAATFDLNIDTTAVAPSTPVANDNVGNVTGTVPNNGTTDDATPTFSGTGTPGDVVTVYDGTKPIGSAVVAADGTYSITPTAPLTEGAHTITATATDPVGNTSEKSPATTLVVDTTPPAKPGTTGATDDVGAVSGPITNGTITDDTLPTFTGTGTAGDLITVYDGGTPIGSGIVAPDGTYSITPSVPLVSGPHSVTTKATDPAGNTSVASDPLSFTVMGDAPAVPAITSVVDNKDPGTGTLQKGETTNDDTLTVSGTGTPGSVVHVYEGSREVGSALVDAKGEWSLTTDALGADGIKNITANAEDAAGQQSPSTGIYDVVLDTAAPAKPGALAATDDVGGVTGPIANGSTTDDATPTFSGTGTPGDVVTVYDGTTPIGSAVVAPDGTYNVTPTTPLSNGDHSITTKATDPAGNTSASSDPLSFKVDTSAVGVTIDKAQDNAGTVTGDLSNNASTNDTTPTLVGTATANAVVTISEGSTVLGSTTASSTGAWNFTPATEQSSGAHTYTATAANAAGTTSTATFGLNIDTTAPAAPLATVPNDDVGSVQGVVPNNGTTDDAHPTFTGTGTPGDVVTVYDGNTPIGSAVVAADGTYSITPTAPLTEGAHTITATATDPVGNTSEKSPATTLVVDTTPPAKPGTTGATDDVGAVSGPITNGTITDDTLPTFTGTGTAGDLITVYDGGTPIGSGIVAPDGTYSITPSVPLVSGPHSVTTKATDPAGNTSVASDPLSFTVDTSAVNVTINKALDNAGTVTGDVVNNGVTNDTTPTLVGTATANAVVIISEGSTVLGSTTASSTGEWSFTPATAQSSGDHTYTATAANSAGTNSSGTFALTIDTTAAIPSAPVPNDDVGSVDGVVPNNGTTDDTTPTFTGTCTPGDVVTVYDGSTPIGSAVVAPDGTYSITPTAPLAEGSHSITATATDPLGNTSEKSAPTTLTVDTTAPGKPVATATDDVGAVSGPISNGSVIDDTRPTFTGTGTPGDLITVYDGDTPIGSGIVAPNGNYSITPTVPLAEGPHSATITATDPTGNTSAASDPLNFTVDASAVAVTIDKAQDNVGTVTGDLADNSTTNDTTPTLVGTATPNAVVTISEGGTVLGSTTASSTGEWSFTPATPQGSGAHTYTVTAVNAAGTNSTDTFALTIDTTVAIPSTPVPNDDVGSVTGAVPNNGTTNDTTPTFTGAGTPGELITVYDGATPIGSAVVAADGTYSITPTSPLAEGPHSISATATDPVGNTSEKSAPTTLTVDTTPPAKPGTTAAADDLGAVSGPITNGTVTDDTRPTFSGTGTPGDLITVFDGDTPIGSGIVAPNGTYSITPTAPLAEGPHSVTTTATDPVGNTSAASDPLSFTVDASTVVVKIDKAQDNVGTITGDLADSSSTNDTTPTLVGTATPNAVVTIREGSTVLGSTTASNTGEWSFTPTTAQSSGAHTYSATAVNAAGTSSTPATFGLNIDNTALVPSTPVPNDDVASVTGAVPNNGTTNDATPTFTGAGTPGELITVYDGNTPIGSAVVAPNGTYSITPTAPLAEGPHSISATATDSLGNTSEKSAPTTLTVDSTVPAKPVIAATDDVATVSGSITNGSVTDDTRPTFTGTGTPGDLITVYDGGTPIGSGIVAPNGTYSITPTAPLAEGPHSASITATDPAGNTSVPSDPLNFTVDTSAPVVDITAVQQNPDGTITTSGTTDPGAPVELKDAGGNVIGTVTAGADGTWSITSKGPVQEGDLTATATDVNGAKGTTTEPYADNTPPAVDITAIKQNPDGTITTSGTAEPGAVVELKDPQGNVIGTFTAGADGTWSISSSTPVKEGDLMATATDINGEKGTTTEPYADTTPPKVAISDVQQDANGTLTVAGTTEPGATVEVKDSTGKVIGTATAGPDGKWTASCPGPVSEGDLKATATDINGETATASALTHAPTGTDATLNVNEDVPKTLTAADFGFGDSDGHSLSSVRITHLPTAGTLTLDGAAVTVGQVVTVADINAGKLAFASLINAHGNDYATVQFKVIDSSTSNNEDFVANTLTLNVISVNDAPVRTDIDGKLPDSLGSTGLGTVSMILDEGTTISQNAFNTFEPISGPTAQVYGVTYGPAPEGEGQYAIRAGRTSYAIGFNFAVSSGTFTPYKVFSQELTGTAGEQYNAGFWAKERETRDYGRFTYRVMDGTTVLATGDTGGLTNDWLNYLSNSFVMPTSGKVTLEIWNARNGSNFGNDPLLDDIGLSPATGMLGTTDYTVTGQTGASTDGRIVLNGAGSTGSESITYAFEKPVSKITATWTQVDVGDNLSIEINGQQLKLTPAMFSGSGMSLSADGYTALGQGAGSTYTMTINAIDVPGGVINSVTLEGTGGQMQTSNFTVTEENNNSASKTVSELFGATFSDVDPHGMLGVVVTSAGTAADKSSLGSYAYSSDNGLTWQGLAAGLSDANAVFLKPTDLIRFERALLNPSATARQELVVRLVDDSGSTLPVGTVSGTTVDASTNGGTTSISGQTLALMGPGTLPLTMNLGTGVSDGATSSEATATSGVVTVTGEQGSTIVVTFIDADGSTITKSVVATGSPQAVTLTADELGDGAGKLSLGSVTASAVATDSAGNSSQPVTQTFTLVQSAPTLSSTSLASNAALFGTATTAAADINGSSGSQVTPTGWTNSGGTVDTADQTGYMSSSYTLTGISGPSQNSGGMMALFARNQSGAIWEESAEKTLTGLVAGTTYTIAFEWQKVAMKSGTAQVETSGGKLEISLAGTNVQSYSNALAWNTDNWQTAVYTFTATGTTATIRLSQDYLSTDSNGGWILVDSLSVGTVTSPAVGVALSSLVTGATDSDGTVTGYAITAAGTTSGKYWQYYNGSAWVDITSASESSALYLSSSTMVRWSGSSASYASLSMVAVDNTGKDAGGRTLDTGEVINATTRGGSTAYSQQVATISGNAAPIVIDRNGDGLLGYVPQLMDVNTDGQLDLSHWAAPKDGVLVWNKFANGMVSDASQYMFTAYGGNTDLQGLRQGFDSNADGVFDAQDERFAEFGVWQDANGNGVSDAGEVRSLSDLGIKSIQLFSDNLASTPVDGVNEAGRTLVTMADGSTRVASDVAFSFQTLPQVDLADVTQAGVVDLCNGQAQLLKLSLSDLLQLAPAEADGGVSQLRITGDGKDVVDLRSLLGEIAGGWMQGGTVVQDGHTYNVYQSGTEQQLQVLIDQQLTQIGQVL